MSNVYSYQNLTLHTVYNVTDPKTLDFFQFHFFAVSWFKKRKKTAICCNYSNELHHHRWKKIHKVAESRFQWLGNPWIMLDRAIKICSPHAHTLHQCPQRYNHMLLYHMLLRAASLSAQILAPGMNWGGEQMKLYFWHVSMDSSLFLYHALIVQEQELQNHATCTAGDRISYKFRTRKMHISRVRPPHPINKYQVFLCGRLRVSHWNSCEFVWVF